MASSVSKLEAEVEIKSSSERAFCVLSSEQHHLPNAASDKIQHVSVHQGSWESSGSVKLWKYTIDGVIEEFKEMIDVDEENKTITMTCLEGHALDLYKSYKIILRVVGKSEGGLVKITIEYEKRDETVSPPNHYLNFVVHLVKDMDSHILITP